MTNDAFGFPTTKRTVAEKVKAFTPKEEGEVPGHVDLRRVDAAGAALGFVAREERPPVPLRRRREIGPTVAINMRVPEEVAARFIHFCEGQRMSYWEGVEELMKRSKV